MPTLEFKGKSVIQTYHHTVPHCRLEFDSKLSLLAKGEKPSLEGNLIIEGDNLLALKALLPTHAGKVKCIYIDPPYNTGNEGWVYNDNLTQPQFKEWIGQTVGKEGEDATRHDKWCCMMYPRLALLKELLRDDGSIWISIDDNEAQNLRGIMDELFGPECFASQIAVLNNRKGRGLRTGFAKSHDYLVVYSKQPNGCVYETIKSPEQIEREYPERDEIGPFRWLELRNTHREFGKHNRPNLFFPLYVDPTNGTVHLEAKRGRTKVEPIWDDEDEYAGCWSWSTTKAENKKHDLLARKVNGKWKVYRRSRPTPRKPKTLWHKKGFLTERGQKQLTSIFGKRVFHAPKPLDLLVEIISFATRENDIVLDSFAGSGTTAHAVLQMNHDDSKKRSFVLIQQKHDSKTDEDGKINVAHDITRERTRRVIEGQWATNGTEKLPGHFSYTLIGEPLFSEYKNFGKNPPKWETIARYVFYTETSREADAKRMNEKTGFIGETEAAGGTSYYLFYSPDNEENQKVSLRTLPAIIERDKNRSLVIYAERIWLHADELEKFAAEHKRRMRTMVVPFGLK